MILNQEHLNQRMSVDNQKKEIQRIKNAAPRTVLYTVSTCSNTDVIETLFHRAGVMYTIGVADYTAYYYKA